ncbi:MAG: alpha-L-fucosidase [Phycisphaerae bacterium]|mgnify:CR=1 FL=1|nr:alpha-L-fucosidase [Phycisphaerae bacterium]
MSDPTKKISAAQSPATSAAHTPPPNERGSQRHTIERLHQWETLGYGMFIHFGMSTFVNLDGKVYFKPDGSDPPSAYAPDQLDVEQWISVARDAGMKYAVLTAKHIAGFCLWPSRHTDYSVARSGNPTDVVGRFVEACRTRGLLPGLYYSSYDNHHRWGSRTRSDFPSKAAFEQLFAQRPRFGGVSCAREDDAQRMPYTTAHYQTFQTAQITELLSDYGPIMEVWIDHPDVMGRGYRTFFYEHIARLQPDTVVLMNNGLPDSTLYDVDYAWPADLMAMEGGVPPAGGYRKWRLIEDRWYYLPGEVCDSIAPIRKDWFHLPDDQPRPIEELLRQFRACRDGGANYLLNVPPDRHGRIPEVCIAALSQIRREMEL